MHKVLVNCLGGLSLPKKSVARLTDCPDMTLDVYRGRQTTITLRMCFRKLCSLFGIFYCLDLNYFVKFFNLLLFHSDHLLRRLDVAS